MKKLLYSLLLLQSAFIMAQTSETVVTPNGKKVTFFPTLSPAWYVGGNTNGALKSLGTKDNFNLPFITNNVERMTLTTAGYLGINTNAPSSAINIVNDNIGDGYDDLNIASYGVGYSGSIFINSANNTKASPAAMDAGTTIGQIAFRGYNGSNYTAAFSGMRAHYMGTANSDLRFYTSNAERLRIEDGGNVGIGTTNPSVKLEVNNGATAGAVKIVDGTQGSGKVLTSDADGKATWQSSVNGYVGSITLGNGTGYVLRGDGDCTIDSYETEGITSSIKLTPGMYILYCTSMPYHYPMSAAHEAAGDKEASGISIIPVATGGLTLKSTGLYTVNTAIRTYTNNVTPIVIEVLTTGNFALRFMPRLDCQQAAFNFSAMYFTMNIFKA
ncbi:hypothetical protein SAMN06265349_1065 [Flavobacterium resistens]|uniref:Uncharacterized protein n=1 Tax=Flavobacterium resistens TaxID=443612 RepID=A0A521EZC6_9FLAO|nr:hypothetical protein [Flavobacterium resistens]MRX69316.1 hypothetical protein [Flavobacterium resistens]SMO89213.1 hypothetical protein SAMN06265349_1065 [Flavobacterium resistens]